VVVLVGVHRAAEDEHRAVRVKWARRRRVPRQAPLLELVPALLEHALERAGPDLLAVNDREDVHRVTLSASGKGAGARENEPRHQPWIRLPAHPDGLAGRIDPARETTVHVGVMSGDVESGISGVHVPEVAASARTAWALKLVVRFSRIVLENDPRAFVFNVAAFLAPARSSTVAPATAALPALRRPLTRAQYVFTRRCRTLTLLTIRLPLRLSVIG